jgi:hypothetical protein
MRYSNLIPEEQKYFQAPKLTCNVCSGAYPSKDLTACTTPLIPGDNCVWGALDDYGKNHCMKCKSGYVSQQGVCKISFTTGCMYQNGNGQCVQCQDGYFMKFAGVCAINTGFEIASEDKVEVQVM